MQANEQVIQWVISKAGKAETLQELLIALCSLGAHSEIGDWKAQGTINRVLAFYNEGGKALFNYDLGQNLHNQHPNFYQYVLPLIS